MYFAYFTATYPRRGNSAAADGIRQNTELFIWQFKETSFPAENTFRVIRK